ncbi:MAG: O-antigen ligase family protein [Proteobacteria bacterium]|nr:O-antigen ligase family protein [Pseudomonadota bacterium]MBU1650497.1 O-antigen ligase family protein [Pseudomonadota bacterium]
MSQLPNRTLLDTNMALFNKNFEIFSRVLFASFYVFLLVELCSIFSHSPDRLTALPVVIVFFLITFFNSSWGLWLFIAVVPLINGLFMVKGFGDISLAFTGVYLAWYPKYLLKQKKIQPLTSSGFYVDLLIAIILLNLFLSLVRIAEFPLPSRSWLDWFSYFPFVSQKDILWQIRAAIILLKGLFLFRMLEVELKDSLSWLAFTKTIYVQASIIAIFSIFQFISLRTRGEDYIRLYFPFNDTHSYGSYVVLLLVIFSYLLFHRKKYLNECEENQNIAIETCKRRCASFSQVSISRLVGFFCHFLPYKKLVNSLLVVVFILLCVYSFSRMTWLAGCLFLFLLFITKTKNKKVIISLCLVLAFTFIVGSLFAPKLIQSGKPSFRRLGTFLNIKDINKDRNLLIRYELWGRSVAMVKDFPLTGVGVGNFYRNNVSYENRSLGKGYVENAHNYYLQLSSELGIPGIFLFISILASLYLPKLTPAGRAGGLASEISVKPFLYGLGAYLVTMLTGHPLLLPSQQFLFWSMVAIISKGQFLSQEMPENNRLVKTIYGKVGCFVFSLYLLGFCFNVITDKPWTIPAEYGLYSNEDWEGTPMRWMAGKAEYYLPENSKKINLKVVAQPFNSQKPDGLTLTVSLNNSIVDRVHFVEGGTRTLSYDVSAMNKRKIKVNLEVSKVFCPKKIGLNSDSRILGVALSIDDVTF